MRHRGHVMQNHDESNHHFLNDAKTLLAKLNGVSSVTEITSDKVYSTSKRRVHVAILQSSGKDDEGRGSVKIRYFSQHHYQDITVKCDVTSTGRVILAVENYVRDYEGAYKKRRMQRNSENY